MAFDERKFSNPKTDGIDRNTLHAMAWIVAKSHVRLIGARRPKTMLGQRATELLAQLPYAIEAIASEQYERPAGCGECHGGIETGIDGRKTNCIGCAACRLHHLRVAVVSDQFQGDVEPLGSDTFTGDAMGRQQSFGKCIETNCIRNIGTQSEEPGVLRLRRRWAWTGLTRTRCRCGQLSKQILFSHGSQP